MFVFSLLFIVALGMTALSLQALKELSDEELLAHYNNGNMRAFECLYERHRKPVYNFILRSVRSPQQAEEVMQEVFLSIIQNASGYVQKAKFTTWLYTIARNRCIDMSRRRNTRGVQTSLQQPMGRDGDDSGRTLSDVVDDPTAVKASMDRAFGSQFQEAVQDALENVPEEQREVFLMRMVSGLSYQEIGDALDISENTAKSRMRYALGKLRGELEALGYSSDDLVA